MFDKRAELDFAEVDKLTFFLHFRDKLKMLGNNLNMMSFEMTKICKTYKINDFNKDKISTYPEEAQSRLTSASTCVEKAEQTLTEFKEFLKTEKYKEWNDEQVCLRKIHIHVVQ